MILISLGANLPSAVGSPDATLRAALGSFRLRGMHVERQSRFYRSAAWPDPSDPPFVNAVARLTTEFEPAELLRALHEVEAEFGRVRGAKNAPRSLDLDLIDYGGRIEEGPPQLPHPRIEARAFVLVPLRDVAPRWRHPVSAKTVSELIAAVFVDDLEPLP
jgi:2-amino-4-hydroxy-6-hydroxymethyldihydropteridine diphosphokinase